MTRDEHRQLIQKIVALATPENQATMTELLTQLSDDYEQVTTNIEDLTARNTTLTTNNETLRAVNAKLFLKVGETDKINQSQNVSRETPPAEEPEETLTYEALFNEKGDLL